MLQDDAQRLGTRSSFHCQQRLAGKFHVDRATRKWNSTRATGNASSAASLAISTDSSFTPLLPRASRSPAYRLCATQTPGSRSPRTRAPPAPPRPQARTSPPRSAASAPPGNAAADHLCAYSLRPLPPLQDEADQPNKPDALTGRLPYSELKRQIDDDCPGTFSRLNENPICTREWDAVDLWLYSRYFHDFIYPDSSVND